VRITKLLHREDTTVRHFFEMRFFACLLVMLLGVLLLGQTKPAETEDPGPPVLKRGPNAPRKAVQTKGPNIITPPQEEPAPEAVPRAVPVVKRADGEEKEAPEPEVEKRVYRKTPADPLVDSATIASAEFDEALPNFICDEVVKRSRTETRPVKWKLEDRVEVELLYSNRKEEYRNIRINGKPLKAGATPEDSGSWSSGDFGATLQDVLSPATDAKFVRKGMDKIAGLDAVIFDYTVEKANSHWNVRFGAGIKPAYKGSIWIDPVSKRVLRVEMIARQLPSTFELNAVEMMVEYGWVTISEQKYLLPTKAENLACFTGSLQCSRNELEFKNYRRFAAESTISTTESSLTFDGEDKPAAEKKPAAEPKKATKKQK
jgi:hypothetical protein